MEKIIKFLSENSISCMATCGKDATPRASAMEYIMVNNSIIFATFAESIKVNNIRDNNKISVSVHNLPKFVTLDGTTVDPTKEEIKSYITELFIRHPEFKELIAKGIMKPFEYFKVVPKTVYFNDYSMGMSPTRVIQL